jgi:signal peptide peptidase SppA
VVDRFARIARAVRELPWAILPTTFDAMLEVLELRSAGGQFTAEEIAARIGDRPAGTPIERVGPVAVLPLHGVIAQRMNLFTAISGGTSTELFGKAFDEAMADPEVQAIVLDIDSPGGSVAGTEELAQKVFKARGAKPIVAIADSLAGSAAYWIGSQADQFVASPSSQVGSIGVLTSHTDVSKAEDAAGVKTSVISIPDAKSEGHPYAPLSDDARANVVASMQPFYDMFLKAVARGRGVSVADVRDGYGQGRVLGASPAKDAGMVDRIEALPETIARLSTPQGRRAALRSVTDDPSLRATSETTAQELAKATAQESAFRDRVSFETQLLNL